MATDSEKVTISSQTSFPFSYPEITIDPDHGAGRLLNPPQPFASIMPGIDRVEICDFPQHSLPKLRSFLKEMGLRYSVHFPLHTPDWYPFFSIRGLGTHPDPPARELHFRLLKHNLNLLDNWQAEYMVLHFNDNRPADDVDLNPAKVETIVHDSAERLNQLSMEHGLPIFLEYQPRGRFFRHPYQFAELAAAYPSLGICLDTGKLARYAWETDRAPVDVAREIAPYTRSMHVWNTQPGLEQYGHIMPHPSQDPAQGWIDLEAIVSIVLEAHPTCPVVVEPHFMYNDSEKYYQEGMAWIRQVVRLRHSAGCCPSAGCFPSAE